MSRLVLDCSVAVSWFLPDEQSNNSSNILELVSAKEAIVPSIWPLEVGNTLIIAERRKRITREQRHNAIYTINELSITIDTLTSKHAFSETTELAERYELTLYDASYLELAIRMGLPLATFDKKLKNAAKLCNIDIVSD